MKSHAHFDRTREVPGLRPEDTLEIDGRRDGVASIREDNKAAVAFTPGHDIDAVVGRDRVVDDLVVADHGDAHEVFNLFPEASTSFDVGKEKGHGAGR